MACGRLHPAFRGTHDFGKCGEEAARFLGFGAMPEPLEEDDREGWYHAPPPLAARVVAIRPPAPSIDVVCDLERYPSRSAMRQVRWQGWRFDQRIRLTLEFVFLYVSFLSSDGLWRLT